ncbi:MAG: hypothetical protein ABL858_02635 [Candidatus Nitrotoga sp.]
MANSPINRNWVDVCWGVFTLFAALVMAGRFAMHQKVGVSRFAYKLSLILLAAYLLRFSVPLLHSNNIQWFPLAMEIKPVFYLLIALVLTSALRQIDDSIFLNYACVLAVYLVGELLLKSLVEGTLVRPFGSGEVNYDAALLVIALVIAYTSKQKVSQWQMNLVWFGLLITFSRTSVITAVIVHLCVRKTHFSTLILLLLVSSSFVLSFLLRDLSLTEVESIDRYLMWVTAIDFIDSDYWGSAFGVFPGNGLMSIDVPPALQWLWDRQGDMLGISGVYAFYFHSALLRLTITWGWVPVLMALLWGIYMILSRRISMRLKLLIITTTLLSLTMGVFYLSNVGVIWWLAVLSVPELMRLRAGRHGKSL